MIVGWAYDSDLICDPHMFEIATNALKNLGKTGTWMTADNAVTDWAKAKGIDPEGTHDTNHHPKPIFTGEPGAEQRCSLARCGDVLGS